MFQVNVVCTVKHLLYILIHGENTCFLQHGSDLWQSYRWLHLVFSGIRVTRSLVLCVCFVDRCLSFCNFSFGHYVVCSSSIYGLLLSLEVKLFLKPLPCYYEDPPNATMGEDGGGRQITTLGCRKCDLIGLVWFYGV